MTTSPSARGGGPRYPVTLMGAVDATARVAHSVLGLTSPPHVAAWQRSSWIAKVTAAAPGLGALFQAGTDELNAHTILRLLRNSIHGEALQALAVGQGRCRDRTLVSLPASEEPVLRAAFTALGGLPDWGVENLIPGRLHLTLGCSWSGFSPVFSGC